MLKRLSLIALSLAFVVGCAGQRRDAVLERSADRTPDWALKQSYEQGDYLYVVGEGTDPEGYALAGRMAKANAVQTLAEVVGLKAKSELVKTAQRVGLSTSGSFIQDSVAMTTEYVTVQDLTHHEDYRDKVELAEDGRIRYRVLSAYRLPLQSFRAAKVRALETMQGRYVKAQDLEAKRAAQKLLDEVKAE